MIRIEIPIEPTGQMRPRFRSVNAKDGRSFGMAYKAKSQKMRENKIIACLLSAQTNEMPWSCPVGLRVVAEMAIPKSYSKAKRVRCLDGNEVPAKKPDLSNIVKQIEDCGNTVLWVDDKQIVYTESMKKYGERPRWIVEMWRV